MSSNRRESVGRKLSRQQSASGPPRQQLVSVAVLPPRLSQGFAPPNGIAAADCFNWDERVNWTHNEPIEDPNKPEGKKSLLKRVGLTTDRKKRNEDMPPFQFRQVPYDDWRKHYAKDADGNYRGTHAPAEDCLLKPEDVAKWRLEAPKTKADLWTRGSEVLPVYAEVRAEGELPEYQDATTREELGESGVSGNVLRQTQTSPAVLQQQEQDQQRGGSRRVILNGMTAEEIIAAEREKNKNRPKGNMSWKDRVKRGAEIASMGSGAH
ncbi:uncharacterized protein HMPREF1541_09634 [Cyphellophora europaea CBS 101466]|uniref:Uncharacterized protein n=1 Tax=Cyphellophora europaea (strain CBS 101466) TaxID=1220924 RepID=W2SAQ5_CYPE1|nr:uncharacterized protein HMPREF1541_09634 [Cyphellophora europaea CBS 101466]ETN45801.1 hypothetical protein HMPREF1541_09634 [Cyphellophora europaea CBS 101466]